MEYTCLGRTGLQVSRLAFGCEPLGGTDWGDVDLDLAMQAVRHAWEQGVTTFDVADVYGLGRAETLLAKALGNARHNAVIVTKGGVAWELPADGSRARTRVDNRPAYLTGAIEQSLRRLRIEAIPLYLVHWPDAKTPIEEIMTALLACRDAGKIREIGLSNFSIQQVQLAREIAPLASLELPYNLLERQAEDQLLPLAQAFGIGVLTYGPLAQGLLTGKYQTGTTFPVSDRRHRLPLFQPEAWPENSRCLQRLQAAAQAHARTLAQTALRWVLDHPAVTSVIVGAKSPAQVDANLAAMHWSLSCEERKALAGASLT